MIDALTVLLEDPFWGGIGAVFTLAGFAVVFYLFFFEPPVAGRRRLEEELNDPPSRAELIVQLEAPSWFTGYRRRIERLGETVDAVFGRSWRSTYERSLQIAFVYPIALFALAWLLGGSGRLGEISLLPKDHGSVRRVFDLLVIAAIAGAFVRVVHNRHRFEARLRSRFGPASGDRTSGTAGLLPLALASVAIVGLGGVAFAVIAAVAIFGTVVGAGAVAVAVLGTVVGTAAVFAAVVAAAALAGAGEFAMIYGIFYLLLPTLNAAFDCLSWIVTRWFIERAKDVKAGGDGVLFLMGALAADIAFALVCVIGLTLALPVALELVNLALRSGGLAPVPWRAMVETATRQPLTDGLLVTGMLATTLVPTMIHVGVGLHGSFCHFDRGGHTLAEEIRRWDDPVRGPNRRRKHELAAYLYRRRYWMIPALAVSGVVIFAIVYGCATWAAHYGLLLRDLAFRAGDFVAGAKH